MSIKEQTVIPAGSLLTITTGVYSDYMVNGVFRALRDIDHTELKKDWLAKYPDQSPKYSFKEDMFIAEMIRNGYLESVDCFELHLCDYSCIDEGWVEGV